MKNSSWVVVALSLGVGLGLVAGGCGGGKDLCKDKKVSCAGALTCDPSDGLCKCGGRGGLVCSETSLCDGATSTCLSTKCGTKDCRGNTACDPTDSVCKCGGLGGTACGAGTFCDLRSRKCVPALDCTQVACGVNQVCDTESRTCRCGSATCADDESCDSDGAAGPLACRKNKCSGVACAAGNVCDRHDGLCKCSGAFCSSGQACLCPPGAAACQISERSCRDSNPCLGNTCNTFGAVCDPADAAKCKCGGPNGPSCGAGQVCNSPNGELQCQGGDQCRNGDGTPKICTGGLSCDPEDGKCKCGGGGGLLCPPATENEPAHVCVATDLRKVCRRPCTPYASDCPSDKRCFFDPLAARPVAYCAASSGTHLAGEACLSATDCYDLGTDKSMACVGLVPGAPGICRNFCDVNSGKQG
ncbi:MAG: hypothetical protein ACT4TC_02305, partial [Myxococcaceae bacterium]